MIADASNTALSELLARLQRLRSLNPDLHEEERQQLFALAARAGSDAFVPVATLFSEILEVYRAAPIKRFGQIVLQEYFAALELGAKQLTEAGEIRPESDPPAGSRSCAMVPYKQYAMTALERCKVLNRTDIPLPLSKAADAFRRRLEVVDTVMEFFLHVMWQLDPDAAERWCLHYLHEHDGELDPDLVRDMLRVVMMQPNTSEHLLGWAFRWSADDALRAQWPVVSRLADRLLRNHALQRWQRQQTERSGTLLHLRLLCSTLQTHETRLSSWLLNALQGISEIIQRFLQLDGRHKQASQQQGWHRLALLGELDRLQNLYPPTLICVDILLEQPDGASQLALAFLGLTGKNRQRWEEKVLKMAERVVHRAFLLDLKHDRKPVETIRTLTFGDQIAFNIAYSHLNFLTEQFDSIQQRDRLIEYLATFYASYRQADLLALEISKRYKNLMRLLHEDYLNQFLQPDDLASLRERGQLPELAGLLADARQYVDKRRSLRYTVEEAVAAELDFTRNVRTRREKVLRSLGLNDQVTA